MIESSIYRIDKMKNVHKSVGLSLLNVKYLRISCDVIHPFALVFIFLSDRVSHDKSMKK